VGTGSRLDLSTRHTGQCRGDHARATGSSRRHTLVDAITRSTGITSLGHPGNSGSALSARGFTDTTSVMRLYDGTRQYGGVGVSFPFDTWSIDRIEVLRGPASVIYGDGAIGGVVNVIPKSPRAGLFATKSRPPSEPTASAPWPLAAVAPSMTNGPTAWMSAATSRTAGWIAVIPATAPSPALCAGM
jgi:outer membrane cobalamin receptor